jgi:uncharacterized protein
LQDKLTKMKFARINLPLLIFVLVAAAALFAVGWRHIRIDTDIVSSLPHDDPVLRDALHIFKNHPFQDQLTIDVALESDDADGLVTCALEVEEALRGSGLFKSVGMEDMAKGLPQLMQRVVDSLPVLFTARDLEERVRPLLAPENVVRRMQALQQGLLQMDGIGQAGVMAQDPLGLKDIVLAKLIHLAPTQSARIYKGHLLSGDGHHALLTAVPITSGTDGASARQLAAYLDQLSADMQARFSARGLQVLLTPVGAYRAALDNEVIVRADVQRAIYFSTLGIALLLLLTFRRPLIGLLSLLPGIVGALLAFFVFALLRSSMSVIVLGFGGAIISISVDQGITYLLFLDRPQESFGKEAAHEIWAVGLLAELTTVGAFGALMLSDFPIFQQLGLFSALGSCLAFLFVHLVFPYIFPSLPASRDRHLPLPKVADGLFSFGAAGAFAATVFFGVMLFFAQPGFNVNLSAMNTVSQATQAAEAKLASVWGDIFSKIFLMTEADSIAALQNTNDRLLAQLEAEPDPALLSQAFLPSMIFPGSERSTANLAAWKSFWTQPLVAELNRMLPAAGVQAGFTPQAFEPFFARLTHPEEQLPARGIPEPFRTLVGVAEGHGTGQWRQFATLTMPREYVDNGFYERYHEKARIFDPGLFSKRLGHLMFNTFAKLLVIIGSAVALLLLIFFLDIGLTLIALAPVVFAMVCSLGTLSLLGRPLDIPALILAVIVLGTGINYSLFMVRSYQRYGKARHPAFTLIRSSVVMAAASSLIGFGVLAAAQHALLKSAGIAGALGIAYSLLGAFLILPPLLKRRFETPARPMPASASLAQRVRARYRHMEPNARLFARFKLRLDPMFAELPGMIAFDVSPKALVDIGTGYGVPACWLAETYPGVHVYGIEPAAERVSTAARALGDNGTVIRGRAPDLPPVPAGADGAFMLDMLHYLSDDELSLTLARLHARLNDGAPLAIRAVMVPQRRWAWHWWVDHFRNRLNGLATCFRSAEAIQAILTVNGFEVKKMAPSGSRGEMLWARAVKTGSNSK